MGVPSQVYRRFGCPPAFHKNEHLAIVPREFVFFNSIFALLFAGLNVTKGHFEPLRLNESSFAFALLAGWAHFLRSLFLRCF